MMPPVIFYQVILLTPFRQAKSLLSGGHNCLAGVRTPVGRRRQHILQGEPAAGEKTWNGHLSDAGAPWSCFDTARPFL